MTPRAVADVAALWALYLRSAAWIHARRLAASPARRAVVEAAMLQAMTAALKDVSNWKPWSAAVLGPPDAAMTSVLPLVGPLVNHLDHWWVGTVLGVSAATLWFASRRRRENELMQFTHELGRRVHEYVSYAVENPDSERLAFYLDRRSKERSP